MKIASKFILIVICYHLSGCLSDGRPVYERKLNGSYYLYAADEYKEMAISAEDGQEGIGVIRATVFAVGQNDDFIIAKQHLLNETRNMDKATINYFIIPLKPPVSRTVDGNFLGPLSLYEKA